MRSKEYPYLINRNTKTINELMKRNMKKKVWSCPIVEPDGRPDNICNCGYPFDGRPHTSTACKPRNVISVTDSTKVTCDI